MSGSSSLLCSCGSGEGAGDAECTRVIRLLSRIGRPHPHFKHFWPMCCSQIPRHRISSSARLFQCLLTWAARQSEVASRFPSTLRATSRGNMEKQSIRMSCPSCSVNKESWEKQHIVSRPWRMRARRGCDEEEKLDHMALTASRSSTGRASSD